MNNENLHALIDKYEEHFDKIWDTEHDEWQAAKHFRDVWFSPNAKEIPFSQMFNEARKEFDILMDNSYVTPSAGIVKVAEKEPEAVAYLFNDILFADDGDDLDKRQDHMDSFLAEFDVLRAKHFPKSFKYKQDRHSASCYLALFAPEKNYIYRHSVAAFFAKYIEFEKEIGSGRDFHLSSYYQMCDSLVEALKTHSTLLQKFFNHLGDKRYKDDSLHILAFDVMYACKMYNFYSGMLYVSKKASAKKKASIDSEKLRIEKERMISELQDRINELQLKVEEFAPISLLNVKITHPKYGEGVIVFQEINKVEIQFDSCEKLFIIHKKYPVRPTFENDAEIVEALSAYADTLQEIDRLQSQLKKLEAD